MIQLMKSTWESLIFIICCKVSLQGGREDSRVWAFEDDCTMWYALQHVIYTYNVYLFKSLSNIYIYIYNLYLLKNKKVSPPFCNISNPFPLPFHFLSIISLFIPTFKFTNIHITSLTAKVLQIRIFFFLLSITFFMSFSKSTL